MISANSYSSHPRYVHITDEKVSEIQEAASCSDENLESGFSVLRVSEGTDIPQLLEAHQESYSIATAWQSGSCTVGMGIDETLSLETVLLQGDDSLKNECLRKASRDEIRSLSSEATHMFYGFTQDENKSDCILQFVSQDEMLEVLTHSALLKIHSEFFNTFFTDRFSPVQRDEENRYRVEIDVSHLFEKPPISLDSCNAFFDVVKHGNSRIKGTLGQLLTCITLADYFQMQSIKDWYEEAICKENILSAIENGVVNTSGLCSCQDGQAYSIRSALSLIKKFLEFSREKQLEKLSSHIFNKALINFSFEHLTNLDNLFEEYGSLVTELQIPPKYTPDEVCFLMSYCQNVRKISTMNPLKDAILSEDLEDLDLSWNVKMTAERLGKILRKLKNLRRLNLSNTKCSFDGVEIPETIEELDLSWNTGITTEQLQKILPKLSNLTRLNLKLVNCSLKGVELPESVKIFEVSPYEETTSQQFEKYLQTSKNRK